MRRPIRGDAWTHDRTARHRASRASSPTSARSPSCAPAGSARRLPQLYVGLVLYGVSLAMMVRGDLGLAPWDVLHSGLIRHVPITLGQAVVVMSFVVLLLWIPLREMPGHRHDLQRARRRALRRRDPGRCSTAPDALLAAGRADGRRRRALRAGHARCTSAPSSAAARATG